MTSPQAGTRAATGRRRSRGPRLLIAGASALAMSALALPMVQGAEKVSTQAVIREIDATEFPTVRVITQQTSSDGASMLVNGVSPAGAKSADIAASDEPVGVVFVVDTTAAMKEGGAFEIAQKTVTEIAASMPAGTQMGVVFAGVKAKVGSQLSPSGDSLIAAFEAQKLTSRSDAAIYDGLATAAAMFDRSPALQRNMVLITATEDAGLGTKRESIRGDLINSATSLDVVSIAVGKNNLGSIEGLARDARGQVYAAGKPTELDGAIRNAVKYVSSQRVITFTAPADAKIVDVAVTIGDVTVSGFANVGSKVSGINVNPPSGGGAVSGISAFQSDNGKFIGMGLATLALALFAIAVGLMVMRDKSGLDDMLSLYGEEGRRKSGDEADANQQSQFVQRAVEFTSKMAERRGVLTWMEGALERADLPLRAGEAMFFYMAIALILTVAAFAFSGSMLIALVVLGLLALSPPGILNFLAKRRQSKFQAMLPDMLQLLSSTLKAGYSLMQGVEAVSQEVADPVGKELRRIVIESRLGRPLEESMQESADRMNSADFSWAVMAIGIQREVGGNLSELLLTVAETMVHRERLRREVKALTAEGRISAYVLGILPFGVGAAMFSLNKPYIMTLFNTSIGNILLGVAGVGMVGGFLWMNQTIKVDV
ncbi:MAG: type II secretion system F family protein [Acidimicrobiia bacterium]